MKNSIIIIILVLVVMACQSKKTESNGTKKIDTIMDDNFKKYVSHFKPLSIEKYGLFSSFFTPEGNYIYSDKPIEIEDSLTSKYLSKLHKSIYFAYYGYKTILPNQKNILLIYELITKDVYDRNYFKLVSKHKGGSYFMLCSYTFKGKLIDCINIVGSDLGISTPTCGILSKFTISDSALSIRNYNYVSNENSFEDTIRYDSLDKTYPGNLLIDSYLLLYKEGKILHQGKEYKKVRLINGTHQTATVELAKPTIEELEHPK